MASDLKPCICGKTPLLNRKKGSAGITKTPFYREQIVCRCGVTSKVFKAPNKAVEAWNTRPAPAATDTGLETQGYCLDKDGYINRPYVFKKDAEELLAAKDADIDRVLADNRRCLVRIAELEADAGGYRSIIEHLTQRAETAEADNAAQAARIEELEHKLNVRRLKCNEYREEIEALEAKLTAAEKALEPFAAHANDRAVDDTGWRDKETVKIVVSIGDLRKARAVLGGKPS